MPQRLTVARQMNEQTSTSGGTGIRIDTTALKNARAQAEKAHSDLTDLADGLSCAVMEVDPDGKCLFINKVAVDWFARKRDELLGTRIRDLLPPESREMSEPKFRRALKGEHVRFETTVRYPDGVARDVAIEYAPKRDVKGEQTGVIVHAANITERKRTTQTLAELYSITSTRELCTDQKINQILKLGCDHFGLPFGSISHIIDDRYSVVFAECPNGEIPVGGSFALGDTYCCHTLEADAPVAIAHTKHSELAGHPCYEKFAFETYIGAPLLVDGEKYGTLSFTASEPRERPFSQTEKELIRQFADWIGHEIARQQAHEALMESQIRLERISSIDDLTGVLNRRAFLERAATELARFHRTGRKFTAVMIDVDYFKSINDTYGHSVGDEVLKGFARIFSDALRAVDVFGRVGGEEFCAILDNTEETTALMVCERMQEKVIKRFRVEPITWDITCSMGLATVTRKDTQFSTLLQRADHALYRAKEAGRNRCKLYEAENNEHARAG